MASRRRRLAILLLKLVLAVGACELASFLALSFLAQERDPVRSETHVFDAHRNHRLNPKFPGHSRDGFRSDTPIPRRTPPHTVRIIALGTSALYGLGSNAPYPVHPPLTNQETITFQLERMLNTRLEADKSRFRVEVINAGVSAYRTYHHLVYMNARLMDYHPDIVINIDGHNDFYKDQLDDPWNHYAYSTSVLVDQHNRRTFFLASETLTRSLSEYLYTFNLAERIFRRLWRKKLQQPLECVPAMPDPLSGDFESNVTAVAERQYVRDLWQIHQLGEYAGYKHAVFLQPEILLEPDQNLSKTDRERKQITEQHLPAGEAEKMQKIRRLLPGIFRKHGVPFFDAAQISSQKTAGTDLYVDYCHLTPAGAKIAAEHIAEPLYQLVQEEIAERGTAAVPPRQ